MLTRHCSLGKPSDPCMRILILRSQNNLWNHKDNKENKRPWGRWKAAMGPLESRIKRFSKFNRWSPNFKSSETVWNHLKPFETTRTFLKLSRWIPSVKNMGNLKKTKERSHKRSGDHCQKTWKTWKKTWSDPTSGQETAAKKHGKAEKKQWEKQLIQLT